MKYPEIIDDDILDAQPVEDTKRADP